MIPIIILLQYELIEEYLAIHNCSTLAVANVCLSINYVLLIELLQRNGRSYRNGRCQFGTRDTTPRVVVTWIRQVLHYVWRIQLRKANTRGLTSIWIGGLLVEGSFSSETPHEISWTWRSLLCYSLYFLRRMAKNFTTLLSKGNRSLGFTGPSRLPELVCCEWYDSD